MDVDILDEIVEETNRYVGDIQAAKPIAMKDWTPLDVSGLWNFLSLTTMMGLINKPETRDYWSTDPQFATPFFASVMPRNR